MGRFALLPRSLSTLSIRGSSGSRGPRTAADIPAEARQAERIASWARRRGRTERAADST